MIQLYQVSLINHGLMMVGPSGSGKSMAWRVLLKALERLEGIEGVSYVIDPKAISKVSSIGQHFRNCRMWRRCYLFFSYMTQCRFVIG